MTAAVLRKVLSVLVTWDFSKVAGYIKPEFLFLSWD